MLKQQSCLTAWIVVPLYRMMCNSSILLFMIPPLIQTSTVICTGPLPSEYQSEDELPKLGSPYLLEISKPSPVVGPSTWWYSLMAIIFVPLRGFTKPQPCSAAGTILRWAKSRCRYSLGSAGMVCMLSCSRSNTDCVRVWHSWSVRSSAIASCGQVAPPAAYLAGVALYKAP